MKNFLLILLLISFSFFLGIRISNAAQNDQCQTTNDLNVINKCLDDLISARSQSQKATAGVQQQVAGIKARVAQIEKDIPLKEQQILDGEKKLAKLITILNETIRKYYIESQTNCPVCQLLLNPSISDFIKIQAYQQISINQDKALITNAALLVQELQTQKEELKDEKANLAVVKTKLDKVVTEALAYQATLSSQIAQLSAKQQQILNERLAALNIPLYASMAGGCSLDIGKDPGFSNGFGFFTYGVPNRVGLNQYGAWGRAKAGKGYDEILRAYYNFDLIEKRDATINVEGYHGYSLDDYTKRIYEVPNEWGDQGGMEALKAQAIAARSYALAYTNNGSGSICTTQQCQVFQDNVKTGNWERAVDETAGMVMIQGGNSIKAWFSSTHGGYIHSSGDIGWSSTSWTKNAQDSSGPINSWEDLKNNAYDKESKWFYCDWGGRGQNNTAWLRSEELADIANVIMLVQATGGDREITKHLYQTDKPNPAGTDTWDAGQVKTELINRNRTPFDSASSASVTSVDFGSGKTSTVTINGVGFPGDLFKTYFNLRAPANIQIVGPLYDIEPVH